MICKIVKIEQDFLHIPICAGGMRNEVQFWVGDVLQYQFSMELSDEGNYEYHFLDVSAYRGTSICVMVQVPVGISQKAIDTLFCAGAPEELEQYSQLYKEKLRPQYHFSSRRGWLNDPNGLYYKDGVYHMYYQHDPFGTLHQSVNISWGHAVSADLLHWKEHKDAILPWNRDWLVASGSAVVDKNGVAGFGKGAVVAAFTCLGARGEDGTIAPSAGQFLAASINQGESFYRFSQNASIPVPNGADWRDPRIFEEDGSYYIAVYERYDDINGVSFYQSNNLREWNKTKWIPGLYECPDIFPLEVQKTGEKKWLLYGADGLARLGRFERGYFVEEGIHFPLDCGQYSYAGQTFNHEPKNRRIHISWIRGMDDDTCWEENMGYHDMPFSQCMSIPCEITLQKQDENYFVCRYPIAETKWLRGKLLKQGFFGEESDIELKGYSHSDSVFSISNTSGQVIFQVGSHTVIVEPSKGHASVDGKDTILLCREEYEIRILTDRTSVEVFINKQIAATYGMDTKKLVIKVSGTMEGTFCVWEMGKTSY